MLLLEYKENVLFTIGFLEYEMISIKIQLLLRCLCKAT